MPEEDSLAAFMIEGHLLPLSYVQPSDRGSDGRLVWRDHLESLQALWILLSSDRLWSSCYLGL